MPPGCCAAKREKKPPLRRRHILAAPARCKSGRRQRAVQAGTGADEARSLPIQLLTLLNDQVTACGPPFRGGHTAFPTQYPGARCLRCRPASPGRYCHTRPVASFGASHSGLVRRNSARAGRFRTATKCTKADTDFGVTMATPCYLGGDIAVTHPGGNGIVAAIAAGGGNGGGRPCATRPCGRRHGASDPPPGVALPCTVAGGRSELRDETA